VSILVLWPTQRLIQRAPGAFIPAVRRPVREADLFPPFSAVVKNAWSFTSTPPYVFMVWCLVKHRNNFIYLFNILTAKRLCNEFAASDIAVRYLTFVSTLFEFQSRHLLSLVMFSPLLTSILLGMGHYHFLQSFPIPNTFRIHSGSSVRLRHQKEEHTFR
jgi:hypothetical protein